MTRDPLEVAGDPAPKWRWELAAGVRGHHGRGLEVGRSGSGCRVGPPARPAISGTTTRVRGIVGAHFEALVKFPWVTRAARRRKWQESPVDGEPLTV